MKVKELIEKLQNLDENLDIICSTEDEIFLTNNQSFRLLDITSVDVWEAEKIRTEDRLPSLKLGQSDFSRKHVIIEITSDF